MMNMRYVFFSIAAVSLTVFGTALAIYTPQNLHYVAEIAFMLFCFSFIGQRR